MLLLQPTRHNSSVLHTPSACQSKLYPVQPLWLSLSSLAFIQVVCRTKRMGGGFGGKETRSVFLSCVAALAAHVSQRYAVEDGWAGGYMKNRHRFRRGVFNTTAASASVSSWCVGTTADCFYIGFVRVCSVRRLLLHWFRHRVCFRYDGGRPLNTWRLKIESLAGVCGPVSPLRCNSTVVCGCILAVLSLCVFGRFALFGVYCSPLE